MNNETLDAEIMQTLASLDAKPFGFVTSHSGRFSRSEEALKADAFESVYPVYTSVARPAPAVVEPTDVLHAILKYEAEHPTAKSMRMKFEAMYGDMSNVMRAMNRWYNTRSEWNESFNRDREKPVTEADVDEALQKVFFAVRDLATTLQPSMQVDMAKDAARYQWLRHHYSRGDYGKGLFTGAMLDGAIDAAMEPS